VVAFGAGHVDGFIGGEQRDPGQGELLFQLEGVVGVAAGAFDVLTDHGREPRRGAGGFGEQVRQAAGFDVPEPGGDGAARA
jgi:hypothetical protein